MGGLGDMVVVGEGDGDGIQSRLNIGDGGIGGEVMAGGARIDKGGGTGST